MHSPILEHVLLPRALAQYPEDAVIRDASRPDADRVHALGRLDTKLQTPDFGPYSMEDVLVNCNSFR